MLSTDQKGSLAEAAIAYAAIELGIQVFRPLCDGSRYDLIFDADGRLMRVQCKTAVLHGEVLAVPWYSARRSRNGFVKHFYTAAEIDAIAAYSPSLRRCYLLPIDRFERRTYVHLRLAPAKNNQKIGINWADDFAFDATLRALLGP